MRGWTSARAGDVAIEGDNALFLNFGDEARAISTQTSRLESGFDGTVVNAFDVPTSDVVTRAGNPARANAFGVRDGICIKVVVEPAGEGIITAHPSAGPC